MWQKITAGIVVVVAAAFLIRSLFRSAAGKGAAGCGSCPYRNSCPQYPGGSEDGETADQPG